MVNWPQVVLTVFLSAIVGGLSGLFVSQSASVAASRNADRKLVLDKFLPSVAVAIAGILGVTPDGTPPQPQAELRRAGVVLLNQIRGVAARDGVLMTRAGVRFADEMSRHLGNIEHELMPAVVAYLVYRDRLVRKFDPLLPRVFRWTLVQRPERMRARRELANLAPEALARRLLATAQLGAPVA